MFFLKKPSLVWNVLYPVFKDEVVFAPFGCPRWRLFYKMDTLISKIVNIFLFGFESKIFTILEIKSSRCDTLSLGHVLKCMELHYVQYAVFQKEYFAS